MQNEKLNIQFKFRRLCPDTQMVRGLTVGIVHSQVEKEIETTLEQYVSGGKEPVVVVDGVALAFHVVTPENKEHSWDFVHGGSYVTYNKKVVSFISLLHSFDVKATIVIPLADRRQQRS